MTPAKYVTEDSCHERHRGTRFRIWVMFWAICGLATTTAIAVQYVVTEAKSASAAADDLKLKVQGLAVQEEEFKQRVIKSLDETRTELRASDMRLETGMSELRKGQQEVMSLLLRNDRNSGPK